MAQTPSPPRNRHEIADLLPDSWSKSINPVAANASSRHTIPLYSICAD